MRMCENDRIYMDKKILLVGGGGHCRSVLDTLLTLDIYDQIGIIERDAAEGRDMLGIPIVGTDADLPRLFDSGWTNAAVTLGSIGTPIRRRELFHTLKSLGFALPVIADPSSVIGHEVTAGEGSFIGKRAVINSGTHMGICSIVNTGAILEHDCWTGDFAHIAPGATLCGNVILGDDVHVGAGAVVRQGIRIGNGSLIGAGSVVVKDVAGYTEAFGNPCRMIRSRTDKMDLFLEEIAPRWKFKEILTYPAQSFYTAFLFFRHNQHDCMRREAA